MDLTLTTQSLGQTQALAADLGKLLRGGEVFELRSDIGGGKTAFTKGLARGMGIDAPVQSPTFTISRVYAAADGLELHHYDFYRLDDAGIMSAELAESLQEPQAVTVIEWGAVVEHVLPEGRIQVVLTPLTETSRRIEVSLPPGFDYLATALRTEETPQ